MSPAAVTVPPTSSVGQIARPLGGRVPVRVGRGTGRASFSCPSSSLTGRPAAPGHGPGVLTVLRCRGRRNFRLPASSGSLGEPAASAPDSGDEDVPLRCAGLSVSPWGFVAILTPEFCSIAEPQNNLEAAMMADCKAVVLQLTSGSDVERAESIEALTMLQLVQGIDVGVRLPYDALLQACPGTAEGSILKHVTLDSLTSITGGTSVGHEFVARLHVSGKPHFTNDPFTALALALRYKAPVLMSRSAFEDLALETDKVKAAFPEALSVEESNKMSNSITHNISVAWRVNATPIGDSDIIKLQKQLSKRGTAEQ